MNPSESPQREPSTPAEHIPGDCHMGVCGAEGPCPTPPSDFVTQAMDLLTVLWEPRLADLRRRCAEAAMAAAKRGPDAVRDAVLAVTLES